MHGEEWAMPLSLEAVCGRSALSNSNAKSFNDVQPKAFRQVTARHHSRNAHFRIDDEAINNVKGSSLRIHQAKFV